MSRPVVAAVVAIVRRAQEVKAKVRVADHHAAGIGCGAGQGGHSSPPPPNHRTPTWVTRNPPGGDGHGRGMDTSKRGEGATKSMVPERTRRAGVGPNRLSGYLV